MNDKIIEEAERKSFEDLKNYIETCLSEAPALSPRNSQNLIDKETTEAIIRQLENKILDGLVSDQEKKSFIGKYVRDRQFLNSKSITEINKKIESLSSKIELLRKTQKIKHFDSPDKIEEIYMRLSKLPAEIINLSRFEIPYTKRGALFVDIPERLSFELGTYKSRFNKIYAATPQKSLNPEYNLDATLTNLYQEFIEVFPRLIDKAIAKLEKGIENELSRRNVATERKENNQVEEIKKQALKLLEKDIDYKTKGQVQKRYGIVVSLRKKKNQIFESEFNGLSVKKLPWKFFPKGEWTVDEIIRAFKKYVAHDETIDEMRIKKIVENLKPSVCYVSDEGFNRYIAFCFDWTKKVVLECPIYGNAAYVINGDWQEIVKGSKWEARYRFSNQVSVIVHNETWFPRLVSCLKRKY